MIQCTLDYQLSEPQPGDKNRKIPQSFYDYYFNYTSAPYPPEPSFRILFQLASFCIIKYDEPFYTEVLPLLCRDRNDCTGEELRLWRAHKVSNGNVTPLKGGILCQAAKRIQSRLPRRQKVHLLKEQHCMSCHMSWSKTVNVSLL